MKKLILSITIAVASFTTYAQQATPEAGQKGGYHGERSEMRMQKMSESLSLTAEQQEKVKAVMTAQHEKMQTERKANHEAFDSEMKNILTAEQYTKWVAQREEMKKMHEGKKGDKSNCKKECTKKKSKG